MTRVDLWRALWRNTPLRGGLGRRILFWFLVLSLVPLLLSNTVGYVVSRGIIENQMERHLQALADIQAQQVATEVERHQLFLDGITVSGRQIFRTIPAAAAAVQAGRIQEPSVRALQAHLDHELEELRSLTELFVIDTIGTVIAATDGNRLGQDWSLRKLFRRGRVEHFFEADWDTRNGSVVPLYRLAVPIRDEGRGVRGVLGGSVGVEALQSFLRHPDHPEVDVHAFIVDHLGFPVFVSHPHIPVDYRQPFPSPLIDQPPGSVTRYVNYEGVDVVGTSVAVSGVPWLYISEVSVTSALGQLRGLALLAAGLESVFALLLVAIVWTVARSIVAPLRRLVVAAERIRGGDLDVAVGIERDDELGDLGRTFNQMSSELQSSALKIQELHEKEMRRAAQLASVGELASGIAHEIKNPLVGVASGVDLLAKRIGADPRSAALLDQIHAQIRRIESAIHDLLSYARPKEPRLAWTDPKQLVEKLIALVRPQADAARVRIAERHAGALPTIRVDPELLTQALVNLALNAIQAMVPGGVLHVSVELIDGKVGFSISDTGEGMPLDELQRIYRPFYTTKHQGTGLGLAITRSIVERHGGYLTAESKPGEGSTFTLVIPATTRREALVK
ncbi:MAG: ATP-binding protein [Gemmatimonadales bacterium]